MFLPRRALHHRRMRTPRPSTLGNYQQSLRCFPRDRAAGTGPRAWQADNGQDEGSRSSRLPSASTQHCRSGKRGPCRQPSGGLCARVPCDRRVHGRAFGGSGARALPRYTNVARFSQRHLRAAQSARASASPTWQRRSVRGRSGTHQRKNTAGRTRLVEHRWWRFSSLTLE